ncbi:hypothetical protein PCH_Pc20g05410 [Penicillium rubens Wisconsin 54-1255]|uniref:Uncharacterized protein n=1 Tax=Penicillium rubens (strain ATCC 28089 / DSM 1075 / NRRL 1951 / Wisconsin 54-1255) TaxID=500485 RepID=B6HEV0_PENRW|nr:hypothetical protein PCH_Pc20g05410 [Penicillium rubens Wisconsin 54-1255]
MKLASYDWLISCRYHGSRHAWPDGRRHEITSRPQSAASGGANEYLAKILCRGTIPFSEENLVLLALKRDSSLGTASCRQTDHFLADPSTTPLDVSGKANGDRDKVGMIKARIFVEQFLLLNA